MCLPSSFRRIHCDLCSPYVMEPLERCVLCGCSSYFARRGKKWYCQIHAPDGRFLQADEAGREGATSESAECEREVAVLASSTEYRGES
jgi:hypothetical protein